MEWKGSIGFWPIKKVQTISKNRKIAMQASTWKKEKLLLCISPPILPETFFDPGERKKKQETFRQIGCVEKKRRKLCQFETALPKLYNPSTINTNYIIWWLWTIDCWCLVLFGYSNINLKDKKLTVFWVTLYLAMF